MCTAKNTDRQLQFHEKPGDIELGGHKKDTCLFFDPPNYELQAQHTTTVPYCSGHHKPYIHCIIMTHNTSNGSHMLCPLEEFHGLGKQANHSLDAAIFMDS